MENNMVETKKKVDPLRLALFIVGIVLGVFFFYFGYMDISNSVNYSSTVTSQYFITIGSLQIIGCCGILFFSIFGLIQVVQEQTEKAKNAFLYDFLVLLGLGFASLITYLSLLSKQNSTNSYAVTYTIIEMLLLLGGIVLVILARVYKKPATKKILSIIAIGLMLSICLLNDISVFDATIQSSSTVVSFSSILSMGLQAAFLILGLLSVIKVDPVPEVK